MPYVYAMAGFLHTYLLTNIKAFTIFHALSCPHSAFPIIHHNDVRDLTAKLMSEVFHNVQVEPYLQPLSGELLCYKSALHEYVARVDITAASFWDCRHHRSFFDVRVFNTFSLRVSSLLVQLQLFGGMRVINVEPMRSMFVRWNGAALRLLCSPLQGAWGWLPWLPTDALPPFLVTSGILHIL